MIREEKNFKFPLFIDLNQKQVMVIGGGKIALRRVKVLLEFGADVVVIAKDVLPEFAELSQQGAIKLMVKPYENGDLAGAVIAVAATNDRQVNHQAFLEAEKRNVFISVADSKEESTFWFPAIAKNDNIIAGIVSKDGNHKLVKDTAEIIRERLEQEE